MISFDKIIMNYKMFEFSLLIENQEYIVVSGIQKLQVWKFFTPSFIHKQKYIAVYYTVVSNILYSSGRS